MDEIDWPAEEPKVFEDGYKAAQRSEPREPGLQPGPGGDDERLREAWFAGYDAAEAERS